MNVRLKTLSSYLLTNRLGFNLLDAVSFLDRKNPEDARNMRHNSPEQGIKYGVAPAQRLSQREGDGKFIERRRRDEKVYMNGNLVEASGLRRKRRNN